MNAKTVALFVLFLTFGFIAKAEIPGGIIYSNGKDAIYYDFKTEESKSLTSDLKEAVVQHPFAVSESGKFLIWMQDSKFYFRELPTGTPRATQVTTLVYKQITETSAVNNSKDNIKEDLIWQDGDIKNMSLSPDGSRFAFDTICREIGWIYKNKMVYGEPYQRESGTWGRQYPFYAKIRDSYNGIFYISTVHNVSNPSASFPLSRPRYGNVLERPPVSRYKASFQDLGISDPLVREATGSGGERYTGEMIAYKSTIKKSAHCLVFQNSQNWEEGKKLAAFIYQIGDQWGPIGLRVLDSKVQIERYVWSQSDAQVYFGPIAKMPEELQKPREWEILVSCKSCEGLFWKPDGSLTIQSGGDLYSIDSSKIQEGINKSSVTISRGQNDEGKEYVVLSPVNNVFQAEPQLIAQGINGDCLSWISNDAFLFLGKDMAVYLWNQGKIEQALKNKIPSQFYYCSVSPFANIVIANEIDVPPANIAVTNKIGVPPANVPLANVPWETAKIPMFEEFEIAGFKFSCGPVRNNIGQGAVYSSTKFLLKSETEFQLITIRNREENSQISTKYIISEEKYKSIGCRQGLPIPTWFIKIDHKYILIQLLENNNSVITHNGVITYRWMLWPEILSAEEIPNKTALNK